MSRVETRKKLALVMNLVVEGYKNGATLRELATIYECAPGTIRNLLLTNNVDLRKRGRRKKDSLVHPVTAADTVIKENE
jgi:intein-encoded DNA endonuclease-like protein